MARNVHRRDRRNNSRQRLLHIVPFDDPLRDTPKWHQSPTWYQWLSVSLQQTHVRPGHPVIVEHDVGHSGRRAVSGQGIKLNRRSVVTTTWGEWKRRHPNTSVLSLDTGHDRDYSEGAAYRDYFEVLGLTFDQPGERSLAISSAFLDQYPVYQDKVGKVNLVVFTDRSGANRAYKSAELVFVSWDGDNTATDSHGH